MLTIVLILLLLVLIPLALAVVSNVCQSLGITLGDVGYVLLVAAGVVFTLSPYGALPNLLN